MAASVVMQHGLSASSSSASSDESEAQTPLSAFNEQDVFATAKESTADSIKPKRSIVSATDIFADQSDFKPGHRKRSSGSYSQVAYVRTQPLGLPSSPVPQWQVSFSQPHSPSPSKISKRVSLSERPVSAAAINRPLAHRSDSLPSFPAIEAKPRSDNPFRLLGTVDDLPVR